MDPDVFVKNDTGWASGGPDIGLKGPLPTMLAMFSADASTRPRLLFMRDGTSVGTRDTTRSFARQQPRS